MDRRIRLEVGGREMPYENELASKASHYDFVRNPDVKAFLQDCTFLKPPSEEEGKIFAARFQVPPPTDGLDLPRFVMAIDGSYHESEINEQLPSTRIGFVKVGCILVDMGTFASLKVLEGRYVDPFRVAELQENNSALTFALPSANVRWGTRQDVRTSFRAALDAHLYGPITRFVESDPKTSGSCRN